MDDSLWQAILKLPVAQRLELMQRIKASVEAPGGSLPEADAALEELRARLHQEG